MIILIKSQMFDIVNTNLLLLLLSISLTANYLRDDDFTAVDKNGWVG